MSEDETTQDKPDPATESTAMKAAEAYYAKLVTFNADILKLISIIFIPFGLVMWIYFVTQTPSIQYFLHGDNGHPFPQPNLNIGLIVSASTLIMGVLTRPRRTTKFLNLPEAIITYHQQNLLSHFDPAPVEAKLREILAAFPGAVLTPYEQPLNIKILNIQRIPKPTPPTPPSPEKDIFR